MREDGGPCRRSTADAGNLAAMNSATCSHPTVSYGVTGGDDWVDGERAYPGVGQQHELLHQLVGLTLQEGWVGVGGGGWEWGWGWGRVGGWGGLAQSSGLRGPTSGWVTCGCRGPRDTLLPCHPPAGRCPNSCYPPVGYPSSSYTPIHLLMDATLLAHPLPPAGRCHPPTDRCHHPPAGRCHPPTDRCHPPAGRCHTPHPHPIHPPAGRCLSPLGCPPHPG